jgi:anti-sigma factor RsiW
LTGGDRNPATVSADYWDMGCEQFRESLSARLDGEDGRAERATTEAHLAGCPACRRWFDAAATVTRLARTAQAPVGVQVDDAVLDAAPGPGRAWLAVALRALLGTLGAAQFLLGTARIGGVPATHHLHTGADAGGHLWHESAAWNVAVGAGFAWIALRRTRPAGIVVAGYAIILVMSRPGADPGAPPAGRPDYSPRWRSTLDTGPESSQTVPRLRVVSSQARVGHTVEARTDERLAA